MNRTIAFLGRPAVVHQARRLDRAALSDFTWLTGFPAVGAPLGALHCPPAAALRGGLGTMRCLFPSLQVDVSRRKRPGY